MSHAMTWYQLQPCGLVTLFSPDELSSYNLLIDKFTTKNPEASKQVKTQPSFQQQLTKQDIKQQHSNQQHSNQQHSNQQHSNQKHTAAPNYASISPNHRALAYGDGFFSTIGVYQGHLLIKPYHQARIQNHCQALHLSLALESQRQLWREVERVAASIVHGIIKIIIYRPEQDVRGYAFDADPQFNEAIVWVGIMQTSPLAKTKANFIDKQRSTTEFHHTHNGIILQQDSITAICLSSQLASLPKPLAGLKSLNRLDNVLIAGELHAHKVNHPEVAEGLVKDMTGHWVEGVSSNVFYQLKTMSTRSKSDQWFTPPIESSGVAGTMRQAILDKLQKGNQAAELRKLVDTDLEDIDSMFFCNAVKGVIPVSGLWINERLKPLSLKPFSY